jgi:molecular chaperone DnaK (HSP70)
LPSSKEFPPGALELPWKSPADRAVGWFAREHGAKVPGRLVSSAKSWLSHPGVDRRSPILPWTALDGVAKVSPVDASTAYLEHLRDVWNSRIAGKKADERLENQEVLLTVPASFDAVARELTMEAAGKAGLKQVTLLEEPQAAFYAWLAALGDKWRKHVKVGDIILVCDVGGGTTDLTLISVTDAGGDLSLSRLAVGEHILLGGDNMDLALAYAVAATLPQGMEGLDATQRVALGHACRAAKETLFAEPKKQSAPVAVLGRGSKVIGGAVKTELTRELLNSTLLEGFLPRCAPADSPLRGRRVGLTEIGLPYAADPAITRHLARFLGQQAGSLHTGGSMILPSAVLFNGGVFKAAELRRRVLDVLSDWAGKPVPELQSTDLDLAVARGAAYYGQVRRGKGVRIRGGVARSYYVGLETSAPAVPGVAPPIKALCVVPMGMEEGTETDVPSSELGLVVGEPAVFRFLSSTTRRDDLVGAILDRWNPEEIQELAPLETALAAEDGAQGETVPVRLHSNVNDVGTLELWCQSVRDPRRWKLEFNVREPTGD